MKAALEAWGADSNLFHQGAAKQSEDPDVVAATSAKPGVVLKRPVGSNGPFKEHAELPRDLAVDGGAKKAALAFEKEQARRERERAKEEAAQRKQRERRQKDVDKAQSALDAARRSHDRDAAGIQAKIEDLEEQSRAEEARWGKERSKLEAALRRARG
jgi:flagellar motility protein MotE (MotC chaperone)